MVMWGVVFFVALTGVSASQVAFPEDVRDRDSFFSEARIVSGWEAEDGQLPHQLSIRMVSPIGGVSSCGGSIIHEEWGLTAAHCTATRVSFMVRAGGVNLTTPLIMFETTEYYNHPEYIDELQSIVQPNDIALLRFGRRIEFSSRVQPIRLQSSRDMDRDYSGSVLVASGWGRTWTNGDSPEVMNWVFLRGVSNFLCRLAFGNSPIIVDSTICAGFYNVSSQSTCQGDSGGPLTVVDVDGQVSLVGVTSFVSATGCHTDIPAGFIRPGHYHNWYRSVTGLDFDWDPTETTTTEATTTESTTSEVDTTTTGADTTTTGADTTTTYTDNTTTEADTTTTEADTTTTQEDSTTTEADTTTTEGDTTTTEADTTTTEGDTTTTESDTNTTEADTTTTEGDTTTTEADITTTEADTTTTESDTNTTEADTTTTEADTTTTEEDTTTTEADTTTTEEDTTTTEADTTTTDEETITTEATTAADTAEDKEIKLVGQNFFSRYFHAFW